MKIKRVRRYRRAKYPKGSYRRWKKGSVRSVTEVGVSSLLLLLTEACKDGGVGTTGPPPVMPDMVTENEARQVITRVFQENGVALVQDVPLLFKWAQDSLALDVDGFNEGLSVGYEYVDPEGESPRLTSEFQTALAAAIDAEGPYIGLMGPDIKWADWEERLEAETVAFIDKLKSLGII